MLYRWQSVSLKTRIVLQRTNVGLEDIRMTESCVSSNTVLQNIILSGIGNVVVLFL